MSDYRMDINGNIGLSEYSNIYDYLGIIDKDDNFYITLQKGNEHEVSIISSMLENNNFFISEGGYDNIGNYCMKAKKVK